LELDNGMAAADLITGDVEEPFRTNVPKSVEAIAELSEADCKLMAEWYQSLADSASSTIRKAVALRRVRDYYDAYLAKHSKQDIERLRAKVYRGTAAKGVDSYKTIILPLRKIKKSKVAVATKPKPETPASPLAPAAKPIASGDYLKSPLYGKKGGKEFIDINPSGMLTELIYDIDGGKERIIPIYLTKTGLVRGKQYGKGTQTWKVTAKSGYAIGAMVVDANRGMRGGFQVVFMKIIGNRLNPKNYYTSPWIGKKPEQKVIIGGKGKPVIGIHGRTGMLLDAIGLVQAAK
jgi:hypothetical protein